MDDVDLFRDGPVLVLSGPLDGRCTAEVREAVYDHLSAYPTEAVVLDLSDVPWVDGTALRMLAVATRYAEREGQHLTLRGCSPHLRRVVRHSRLRALLEMETEATSGTA